MSWLRPDNIQPSDYSPEKKFAGMVERLGKASAQIAEVFNEVDPFHMFFGNNVDEYVGYVEKFFSQLGDRDFSKLSDREIATIVQGSFSQSQVEQGFINAQDLELLAKKIIVVRDHLQT